MLPIVKLFFFFFPNNGESHRSFKKLELPIGSEAFTFDSHSLGLYTSLNDGGIVKFAGPTTGFLDFTINSPNRPKELCDCTNGDDLKIVPICGRHIGLEFNHETRELYIVDFFYGHMAVGSGGGTAVPLTTGSDSMPFDAPDALAIDPASGEVYFTDLGSIFFKTNILMSGDTSGRLLKYDPSGVVVSRDGSFVLVASILLAEYEGFGSRVLEQRHQTYLWNYLEIQTTLRELKMEIFGWLLIYRSRSSTLSSRVSL